MANRRTPPSAEDKKNTRTGCAIIFLGLLLIGGCSAVFNDDDGDKGASGSSSSSPVAGAEPDTIKVGDFVGMQLQAAQDAAQEDGMYNLHSEDYTGQGRNQWADRNWTVCKQDPAAGTTMSTDDQLTFHVVNHTLGETCDDPTSGVDLDDNYTDDDDGSSSTTIGGTGDDDSSNEDSTTTSGGSDGDSDYGTSTSGGGGSSSGGGLTSGGGGFTNGGGGKWF